MKLGKRLTLIDGLFVIALISLISTISILAIPNYWQAQENGAEKWAREKGAFGVLTLRRDNQPQDFPKQVRFEEYPADVLWKPPKKWREFLSAQTNATTLPAHTLLEKGKLIVSIDGEPDVRIVFVLKPALKVAEK